MVDVVEPLVLDLLDWINSGERTYAEVIEAWRTSCPRLPVWEEANDRGFVTRQVSEARGILVKLTPSGQAVLMQRQRATPTVSLPQIRSLT